MRWAGHVARMEGMRNAYNILAGKTSGKRPLTRPRRRWDGIIRMYLRDWVHLAQDRNQWRAFLNKVIDLTGTMNPGNFLI